MTWQLIHPDLVIQGQERETEREREQGESPNAFYDLVSESTTLSLLPYSIC